MGIILGFLKALKLPVKLLKGLVKKRKRKDERERKLREYVRNFSPSRVKNRSWQKYDKKSGKTKFQWNKKRKSKDKKVNNSSV